MKLWTIALALSLGGCACIPTSPPAVQHKPVKHQKVEAPVVAPPADQPTTFKNRWQEFKKKHPIKWTH